MGQSLLNKPFLVFDLAGHRWEAWRVEGLAENRSLFGQCLYPQRRIEVDALLEGASLDETLLHECIHAVAFEFGINVPEKQVRTLGLGLHQMFMPYLKMPKPKRSKK